MTQPAEIIVVESTEQAMALYGDTAEQVRARLAPYRGNTFATPATYKNGVDHIRICRDLRLSFDETRKRLGDLARKHLQFVNCTGNELIDVCREVEDELKATKKAVDAEKARQKSEREAAEKAAREAEVARKLAEEQAQREAEAAAALAKKIRAALAFPLEDWIAGIETGDPEYVFGSGDTTLVIGIFERTQPAIKEREQEAMAIIRQRREAEHARLEAERERQAEESRKLAEERAALEAAKAEQERLARELLEAADRAAAEQQARIAAEWKAAEEAARAEQERLDAERRALDEQKRLAELAEAERQAKARAEQEARDQAAREQREAEEAAVREAERQAELARRLEALRPEKERALAYVDALLAVPAPEVVDAEACGFVATLRERLEEWRGEAERIGEASDG